MSEDDINLIVGFEVGASVLACLAMLPWGTWAALEDAPDWLQAIGSVLAIGAGFVALAIQRAHARRDEYAAEIKAASAHAEVARYALAQVGDRLRVAAKIRSKQAHGLALREYRTTETVNGLRELRLVDIHQSILAPLASLRSDLYAVNARITEIYKSEEVGTEAAKRATEARRSTRIQSSIVIYASALRSYRELQEALARTYGVRLESADAPAELALLIGQIEPTTEPAGDWSKDALSRSH